MTPFNVRLLSLFMISKYAARLHDVIVKLQEACDAFKDLPLDQKKALNSHQELEQWVDFLVEARDLCAELKLVSSQARIQLFMRESQDIPPLRCMILISELKDHIVLDTGDIYFQAVDSDKVKFYNKNFSDQISTAFPSAHDDICEAGSAFALNRYTACAFHLIRAMEIGLRSLARASGVRTTRKQIRLEYQESQNVITSIEGKMETITKWQRGIEKDNALGFFRPCIAVSFFQGCHQKYPLSQSARAFQGTRSREHTPTCERML